MILAVMINRIFQKKLLDSILARIVKYVCCCGGIKSLLYLDVECGFCQS